MMAYGVLMTATVSDCLYEGLGEEGGLETLLSLNFCPLFTPINLFCLFDKKPTTHYALQIGKNLEFESGNIRQLCTQIWLILYYFQTNY